MLALPDCRHHTPWKELFNINVSLKFGLVTGIESSTQTVAELNEYFKSNIRKNCGVGQ